MSAIVPEEASKLEQKLKRIGPPDPLHYANSYGDLTLAQANELTARAKVAVSEARRWRRSETRTNEERGRLGDEHRTACPAALHSQR